MKKILHNVSEPIKSAPSEARVRILEHLKEHLKKKSIILGIGNTLRHDDAAGSILAQRLLQSGVCVVIDCGVNLENYFGKIISFNPATIVIVDAADFGAKPGEIALLEGQDIKTVNFFSTHNVSLNLGINFLQNSLRVDIILLIIQPKVISLGEGLSREMEHSLKELVRFFKEVLPGKAKEGAN